MDVNVQYIILNYYDRMIHYSKYLYTLDLIQSFEFVDYIDTTNGLSQRPVLICDKCRYPILKIIEFIKPCRGCSINRTK